MLESNPNPIKFAKKAIKKMGSPTKLAAMSVAMQISCLEEEKVYTPEKFIKMVKPHYDRVNIVSENSNRLAVPDSKIMAYALNEVQKQFGLINIRGKKEINSFIRTKGEEKLEFGGRPSAYRVPPGFEKIKNTVSNPDAVSIIFTTLQKNQFLFRFLKYRLILVLYSWTQDDDKKLFTSIQALLPQIDLEESKWNELKIKLLSKDSSQLRMLATRMAKIMDDNIMSIPGLAQWLLSLGFAHTNIETNIMKF